MYVGEQLSGNRSERLQMSFVPTALAMLTVELIGMQ